MLIMLKGVLIVAIIMAASALAMWGISKLGPGLRRIHRNSQTRRR